MTHSRITVRYASGDVEHRFGSTLPKVGDRLSRNGDEGFVTSVEADGSGHATVSVGTPAPRVSCGTISVPPKGGRARQPKHGAHPGRGLRALLATRHPCRRHRAGACQGRGGEIDALSALPFEGRARLGVLAAPEQVWTREFVEAEARRRGSTPRERLLAIFDVFDDWFHRDDFEGCSFINVLLEMGDLDTPLGKASAAHLEYIRSIVRTLAEEAGVQDAEAFAHSWHILMKGSIVAAGEGDELAGKRARAMGEDLVDRFLRVTVDPPQPVLDSSESVTAA